jgi:hypothetical protein
LIGILKKNYSADRLIFNLLMNGWISKAKYFDGKKRKKAKLLWLK